MILFLFFQAGENEGNGFVDDTAVDKRLYLNRLDDSPRVFGNLEYLVAGMNEPNVGRALVELVNLFVENGVSHLIIVEVILNTVVEICLVVIFLVKSFGNLELEIVLGYGRVFGNARLKRLKSKLFDRLRSRDMKLVGGFASPPSLNLIIL